MKMMQGATEAASRKSCRTLASDSPAPMHCSVKQVANTYMQQMGLEEQAGLICSESVCGNSTDQLLIV